ncbi:hypothetical protein [Phenylobacterium sp.]|uniref:hypothetical protein n=1 Tax=Phenylobacterium sp. TaxID=1871053 RepID=UPI0025D3E961|nr:hypothetical protein [Phenylobacterium sp.]MBX3482248.1 hypothetical protein [Phenylobacterium sp.]
MEPGFGCIGSHGCCGAARRGVVWGGLALAACSRGGAGAGAGGGGGGLGAPADGRASPEAAAQVVRDYYLAVESGRTAEAADLREDGGVEDVAPFLSLKADIARARPAAGEEPGWSYARVPVALTGRFVTGGDYRASGAVTLRRTDRAGASARERRWRIHRIVVRAAP